MNKMEFEGQTTSNVRKGHEIDKKKLKNYLSSEIESFDGEKFSIRQFNVGQSNPTFLIETKLKKYVLRKKPPGKSTNKTAHQIDREYKILYSINKYNSLKISRSFPVPKVYLLCKDISIIGTEFYIMDFIPGRILLNAALPLIDIKDRKKYYKEVCNILGHLHSIPYWLNKINLTSFGQNGNYYKRQLKSILYVSKQQEKIRGVVKIEAENVSKEITKKLPIEEISILHGDYKFDNFLFHPEKEKIIGVLDWELSTIGHPLSDISNLINTIYNSQFIEKIDPKNSVSSGLFGLDSTKLKNMNLPLENEIIDMYLKSLLKYKSLNKLCLYNLYSRSVLDIKKELKFHSSFQYWRGSIIAQGNNSNPAEQAQKFISTAKPGMETAKTLITSVEIPQQSFKGLDEIGISELNFRKLDLTQSYEDMLILGVGKEGDFEIIFARNGLKKSEFRYIKGNETIIQAHEKGSVLCEKNSCFLVDTDKCFFRSIVRKEWNSSSIIFGNGRILEVKAVEEPVLLKFLGNCHNIGQFVKIKSDKILNGIQFRSIGKVFDGVIKKEYWFIIIGTKSVWFDCSSRSGQLKKEIGKVETVKNARILDKEKNKLIFYLENERNIIFSISPMLIYCKYDEISVQVGFVKEKDKTIGRVFKVSVETPPIFTKL
eukprot:snap_masked-scaffold_21-processed-gene-0.20-mRNA-1 protein AED:1.00 eAED:1.00 QI:0/0/0/0/1/1/2/0/655